MIDTRIEGDNIPNFIDLTGHRFGSWTVIGKAPNHISQTGKSYTAWNCKCDCGIQKVVIGNSLRSGRSTSCGCVHKIKQVEVAKKNFSTHGETKTRLYQIWAGMRKRCNNPRAYNYSNYGGRGITVCKEWDNYLTFRDWAFANGYDDNKSIDRIDVNAGYCPENCRWATSVAQANNRRSSKQYSMNGVTHTLSEWARIYELPYKTLWKKIKAGNRLKDILSV